MCPSRPASARSLFFLPAFEPVLLARKANRIRKELQAGGQIPTVERDVEKVGDKDAEKSPAPPKPSLTTSRTDAPAVPAHPQVILTKYQLKPRSPLQHILHALVRPFALFAYEPIVQLMGVYMAFVYGIFYREYLHWRFGCPARAHATPSSLPHHHPVNIRGRDVSRVGRYRGLALHRVRAGREFGIAGMSIIHRAEGLAYCRHPHQINARMLDRIYVYFKNRNEGKGEPEFRLREWVFFVVHHRVLTTPQLPWSPGRFCFPQASLSPAGRRRKLCIG